MARLSSVCVYCGSGLGADPAFSTAAQALGTAMAAADIRLVYGGGSVGLMGTLARTVLDAGGRVTGIIPRFLQSRERQMEGLSEILLTEDMHERKMLMFEHADAFVALPGGVGTLEEIVEQMTWAQLGRHHKPVLLANIGGFWNPLLQLLDQMYRQKFIRSGMELSYLVAESAEEILPILKRAVAEHAETALHQAPAAAPIARM
jgi:uncharacterized protein (TIGR00730 family)